MRVVFPLPFSPRIDRISPVLIDRLTFLFAALPPKYLLIFFSSIAAVSAKVYSSFDFSAEKTAFVKVVFSTLIVFTLKNKSNYEVKLQLQSVEKQYTSLAEAAVFLVQTLANQFMANSNKWTNKHNHLPDDQLLKEFDKWIVENEDLINESVKNNIDEINVFEYHPIEKGYLHNFVIINTNDLVPGKYFIDLKVKNGRNINYFRECFKFEVVSNITELYK